MPMITKHVRTLKQCVQVKSPQFRPMAKSSLYGEDNPRPSLDPSQRVPHERIRMGKGVDPHKVVEQDWREYYAFMNGYKF